ncbi:hypothetical protein DL765_007395 [Monosporascus sp. GIB2]|nr:hypothetical protein DL765_007395 [Monosporascus sp. GIB2]
MGDVEDLSGRHRITPPGVTPATFGGNAASSIRKSGASNRVEGSGQSAAFPPVGPDALNTFYWSNATLPLRNTIEGCVTSGDWGAELGIFDTLGDGTEFFGSFQESNGEFPKAGVTVFHKKRVVSYDFEAPGATTQNGWVFKADLVVGADGINSIARLLLTGHPDVPRDTGGVAYRTLILREKLLAEPELADPDHRHLHDVVARAGRAPHQLPDPERQALQHGGLRDLWAALRPAQPHVLGAPLGQGRPARRQLPPDAAVPCAGAPRKSFKDAATLRQCLALDLDLCDALSATRRSACRTRASSRPGPRAPVHPAHRGPRGAEGRRQAAAGAHLRNSIFRDYDERRKWLFSHDGGHCCRGANWQMAAQSSSGTAH